jgi:valyl-tRNA synthetase
MLEKKYKFLEVEKKMQDLWEEKKVFKYDKNATGKTYSVDTPPPTVSGGLHIGHAASYTQAEVICRFKKITGHNVFYPLGFDNNGLPSERLVERTLGIRAKDVSREEFITLCMKSIEEGVDNYRNLFKKLAFSVDWDLSYQTIDEKSRRISQRSFIELAKDGNAYRSHAPVQWCTDCKTSIAMAETESEELPSQFHTIKFRADSKDLLIATTRPEFLAGCVAVIVNPDDDRFKHLVGKEATVPVYGNKVPILADMKADKEKGTGVVMCCTYGDETDVEWCKKFNLPYVSVITEDGKISDNIEYVGGLSSYKARKQIIERVKDAGLYESSKPIDHMVAVHDRCGTPVELLPSKQWFIKVMNIKGEILALADEVNWHPVSMKKRLQIWVENLNRDWLISRQRYFGVPFPVWYCEDCGETILAEESQLPVNPLMDSPLKPCSKCGSIHFKPETDVMDTWATSSVTQLINAKWGEEDEQKNLQPMSVRSQAREIIRTWAFYTLVKSYYHKKAVPWKDLMINGWVLFDKKNKISKSKHKMKSPEQLIEEYSADAIRQWATGTKLGTDMMFDEKELVIGKRFITKLWNASKFSIMQLTQGNVYDGKEKPKEHLPIDNWLINKWEKTQKEAVSLLNRYEIGLARGVLDKFFWDDYCDNYLEFAKERLYQPEKHGRDAQLSGQYTMFKVLYEMLQTYNVFVPHITEYIYQEFYKDFKGLSSLALAQIEESKHSEEAIEFGDKVKVVVVEVRKYKAKLGVSMKEPMDKIVILAGAEDIAKFKKTKLDIIACTAAQIIEFKQADEFEVKIIND